jgi:hypothetical protein
VDDQTPVDRVTTKAANEHPDPEVKTFKQEISGPENADQDKPETLKKCGVHG